MLTHRRLVPKLILCVFAYHVVAICVGFGFPRTLNNGPENSVFVSSGREVHRHDLLRQWRLVGLTLAEKVDQHVYVYDRGRYCPGGPTLAERLEFIAQRGYSPAERALRVYQSSIDPSTVPLHSVLFFHWDHLLGMLIALNIVGVIGYFAGVQPVVRLLRTALPSGCCCCCGYNLTGNISGICPECGTTIRNPP